MKSNCSLIQELLPLYLENDVSDETSRTIEQHLDECQECKDALEQYSKATAPIPEEPVSDPFDAGQGFKKFIRKAKRHLLGASLIILMIMGIIAAGAFFTGQQIGRSITYVANEEDVFDYYADKIPGLKRAQREGNYQNIGRSIDLPDDLGTVFFDKIWYTREAIYVFYHVKPGNNLGRIHDIQLNGELYWDLLYDGRAIHAGAFTGSMLINEWVSCDGLYYKFFAYNNERERFFPIDKEIIDRLKIDLKLTYTTKTNPLDSQQAVAEVGSVEFSAFYDPYRDQPKTVRIDKKVLLPDSIVLEFTELVLEPQKTVLKLKTSGLKGRLLLNIYGHIKTGAGDEIRLDEWMHFRDEDSYEAEMLALDQVPEDLSVVINAIQLSNGEKLSFDLDAKAFHDKMTDKLYEQKVNQKLGTYAGTEYILEKLNADDQGLFLTIQMKSPAFNKDIQAEIPKSWASHKEFLKNISDEEKDKVNIRLTPHLVRFTNEKGEEGGMDDYGGSGGGPEQRFGMGIDKRYVEKSETITVEVMNLVETVSGEWKSE